jgi:ribosomal protein S5
VIAGRLVNDGKSFGFSMVAVVGDGEQGAREEGVGVAPGCVTAAGV